MKNIELNGDLSKILLKNIINNLVNNDLQFNASSLVLNNDEFNLSFIFNNELL